MFPDVILTNRLRYPIRGRVLVATTSAIVEFVGNGLTFSYPLYSVDVVPPGKMLVFCVELDGYLTFDKGSQVKMTPETNGFRSIHYDPQGFALVKVPADGRAPVVASALVHQNESIGSGEYIYFPILVSYSPSGDGTLYLKLPENDLYRDDFQAYLEQRRASMIGKTVSQLLQAGFTLQPPT